MSLQDDLLDEVLEVRQNQPHRQVLYINAFHRNLSPNFYQFLGESMMGNTHLRQLCLDRVLLNESGARALANGIRQSQLQKIELSCYIKKVVVVDEHQEKNEPMKLPQRILYEEGIGASQTIEIVVLRDFRAEYLGGLGEALSSSNIPLLKNLRIINANIQRSAYSLFLSNVLTKAPSLVELQLRRCNLRGDNIIPLARALDNNRLLKTLELCESFLDDRSVGILLEHWQPDSSSVKSLNLSENKIGSLGVQLLLNAAQEHMALTELNLSGNGFIGYEGLRMIGNDLPHQPYLRVIRLEKCVVMDDNVVVTTGKHNHHAGSVVKSSSKNKTRKKAKKAEQALLNGIRNNHTMLELRVDHNAFSGNLCREIALYTDLNRFGRSLLSTNHGLASTVWCQIFGKCNNNNNNNNNRRCCCGRADLIYYFLREQPHLPMQRVDVVVRPKNTTTL